MEQKRYITRQVVREKRTLKLWVWIALLIIFLVLFIFCIINLFFWKIDSSKTKNILDDINKDTNILEIDDNEKTENINEPEDPLSDYWYYIKFPLIDVNFSELKLKNEETVGWINVNNTNINYPFVQTDNNDFYLNHSFDKTYNEAGWVYLDYRNKKNFTDRNTIIYAHSRLDKTMFGSLSKVLKESWYKDKNNHIIRISTETENTLWQIFSVYVIDTETYYITTNFINDNEYSQFLNTISSRSIYDFNTELSTDDRILTLSTCYSDTQKTVVHAKLIKKEDK